MKAMSEQKRPRFADLEHLIFPSNVLTQKLRQAEFPQPARVTCPDN